VEIPIGVGELRAEEEKERINWNDGINN